jgi:hypothetical protein
MAGFSNSDTSNKMPLCGKASKHGVAIMKSM